MKNKRKTTLNIFFIVLFITSFASTIFLGVAGEQYVTSKGLLTILLGTTFLTSWLSVVVAMAIGAFPRIFPDGMG